MPSYFSIPRSQLTASSAAALREEIHSRTGSDSETSSILRSISRFEEDASIRLFEITARPTRGTRHDTRAVSWQVRAVREQSSI